MCMVADLRLMIYNGPGIHDAPVADSYLNAEDGACTDDATISERDIVLDKSRGMQKYGTDKA